MKLYKSYFLNRNLEFTYVVRERHKNSSKYFAIGIDVFYLIYQVVKSSTRHWNSVFSDLFKF